MTSAEMEIVTLPLIRDALDPPEWSGDMRVLFHFKLKNVGRVMARHTCVKIDSSVGIVWGNYDNKNVSPRGDGTFWELSAPLYPDMEIGFSIEGTFLCRYGEVSAAAVWGGPWFIQRKKISDVVLSLSLFADNAPVKRKTVPIEALGFDKAVAQAVDRSPQRNGIRGTFLTLP
jgi:hypothetical protein